MHLVFVGLQIFYHFYYAMCIVPETRYVQMSQDKNFCDKISNIQPMIYQKSSSKAACIGECLIKSACGALFFRTGDCAMYRSRMNAVYNVTSEIGWQFFHRNEALCPLSSGYIYNTVLDKCIKIIQTDVDHDYAKRGCQNDNGSLVKVDSDETLALVKSVMVEKNVPKVYIQGTRDENGIWRNDDNTEIIYRNWAVNEPDNHTNSVYMRITEIGGYLIHDAWGTRKLHGYICEI